MNLNIIYGLFCMIGISNLSHAKNLTGFVIDGETKEPLIGATIYHVKSGKGTNSNEIGYFNFTIPFIEGDTSELEISYVGYATRSLNINHNGPLNIELFRNTDMEEIIISEKRNRDYQIGKISITTKELLKSVQLGGEADIIKSLQLLPSIKMGTEGSSNLFVRGGNFDENLILLDDIPLINTNHLYGLVSVIDPNIISSSEVYAGALPAKYGGKLSSVIDLHSKNIINKKWETKIGLGVLSSKVYSKGTLFNRRLGLLVSARRSNINLIAPLYNSEGVPDFGYTDMYGKLTFNINQSTKLSLFYYQSNDWNKNERSFIQEDDNQVVTSIGSSNNELKWGNEYGGIRMVSSLGNKAFSTTTMYMSKYNFSVIGASSTEYIRADILEGISSEYQSSMEQIGVKQDIGLYLDPIKLNFGIDLARRKYLPGIIATSRTENDQTIDSTSVNNSSSDTELRLYAEGELALGEFLIYPGVNIGVLYGVTKSVANIEPRIRASYQVSSTSTVSASWGMSNQYFNILNAASFGLPTDSYVPNIDLSTSSSNILSLGWAKEVSDHISLSTELYYKNSQGLNIVQPGSSSLLYGDNWRDQVLSDGAGVSYGLELMLAKKQGIFNGWISYTLSKTKMRFREIEDFQYFNFDFDRTHDLKIVGNCKLSNSMTLSINWVYNTGQSITPTLGSYPSPYYNGTIGNIGGAGGSSEFFEIPIVSNHSTDSNSINIYGAYNAGRFPDYHRMDISLQKEIVKKNVKHILNLSIYNIYNRLNAFSFTTGFEKQETFQFEYRNSQGSTKSTGLFPILPSISYTLEF